MGGTAIRPLDVLFYVLLLTGRALHPGYAADAAVARSTTVRSGFVRAPNMRGVQIMRAICGVPGKHAAADTRRELSPLPVDTLATAVTAATDEPNVGSPAPAAMFCQGHSAVGNIVAVGVRLPVCSRET